MKLLLTSAGIHNPSIHEALVGLLGRPIAECDALCVPTAGHGHPMMGPTNSWSFVAGHDTECPMTDLGWRSVGLFELTALPSIGADRWVPWLEAADAVLVNGGDALYLAHWMRETGLADRLASLPDTVWVGLSAGSMVMTPRLGDEFVVARPPGYTGSDAALGVVDFSIFPHVDHPNLPDNTMAAAERWARGLGNPAYAIDDDTAIVVDDGRIEVVSEGQWRRFDHP